MKKKLLCAFLALVMCSGTVMLAVSCADKPSDTVSDTPTTDEAQGTGTSEQTSDTTPGTTPDTTPGTTPDTTPGTTPDTTPGTDENNPDPKPGQGIASLTPSNGKKLKIAFIGDSITQGTGTTNQASESYPGQLQSLLDSSKYSVGNFGKAGSYTLPANSPYNVKASTPGLSYKNTQQYKDSLAFKADVVVIMLGINDMRSMTSDAAKAAFKSALKDLCTIYMNEASVQKVYIATSLHVTSNFMAKQMSDGDLQELQCQVADELGLEVFDVYSITREYMDKMFHYTSDRLHPNKEMYGVMARVYKACLFGEDYTVPEAPKSQSGVVYLKASGSTFADGKTPQTAVNKLGIAVSLVRDGGTIVICGAYSVNYEMHLPENSGLITITSKYNGVDYSAQGAKLGLSKHLSFYGDFKLENITIHYEAATLIACNYNNVTFGDGITSTTAVTNYPTVVCGYILDSATKCENVSLKGECNITFNSGKWSYINGGNRRSQATLTVGSSDKDAVLNITVNGGDFTYAVGGNMNSAIGMNSFKGTCNFTVNGGSFAGNVYAVGRIGTNNTKDPSEMSGTVNMIINGGTFNSKIIAQQDNTTKVTGTVNITIPASYESKISGFKNVTKK